MKTLLSAEAWQRDRREHFDAIVPFTHGYRKRRGRGELHPIYDFLFTYYTYSSRKLENWHPGYALVLEADGSAPTNELLQQFGYRQTADGRGIELSISEIRPKDVKQLLWIRSLCQSMLAREPRFSCFGLHEWAIVYRTSEIRHQYPLRLTEAEVAEVVDRTTFCCSHFDAFRFSAPGARGLNVLQPASDTRLQLEQGGCLHANMDLYKWCYKLIPWVSSRLLRDCFKLALRAREIDMRASPYDFTKLGFSPIPIEKEEGKAEYRLAQVAIAAEAQALRVRLLANLERVLIDIDAPRILAVGEQLSQRPSYS